MTSLSQAPIFLLHSLSPAPLCLSHAPFLFLDVIPIRQTLIPSDDFLFGADGSSKSKQGISFAPPFLSLTHSLSLYPFLSIPRYPSSFLSFSLSVSKAALVIHVTRLERSSPDATLLRPPGRFYGHGCLGNGPSVSEVKNFISGLKYLFILDFIYFCFSSFFLFFSCLFVFRFFLSLFYFILFYFYFCKFYFFG